MIKESEEQQFNNITLIKDSTIIDAMDFKTKQKSMQELGFNADSKLVALVDHEIETVVKWRRLRDFTESS